MVAAADFLTWMYINKNGLHAKNPGTCAIKKASMFSFFLIIIIVCLALIWTYPPPHCSLPVHHNCHKTPESCDWPMGPRHHLAAVDWACLGCPRAPPPSARVSESAAPPPTVVLYSIHTHIHTYSTVSSRESLNLKELQLYTDCLEPK